MLHLSCELSIGKDVNIPTPTPLSSHRQKQQFNSWVQGPIPYFGRVHAGRRLSDPTAVQPPTPASLGLRLGSMSGMGFLIQDLMMMMTIAFHGRSPS